MTVPYEIRPHHTFKGWYIIFKNGVSLGARATKTEAEQFVARHKRIEDLKKMEVKL